MIEVARKRKELITIAITKMPSPYGIVIIEENKIVNFIEKPLLPHYINAGIYYIKKEAIDLFKRDYMSTDVERTVFPKAAIEGELTYYTEDAFWHSIDSIKDVELIRDFYKNREDKPWGWERTLVNNEKYLVKELYIKAGYRTSIHYHKERDETLNVIRGLGYLEIFDNNLNLIKKEFLATNSIVRIRPNTIHSIVAEESLLLQEYSTPYPNDVVRLKDFYLR
jgi:Nucleoside-diphosphate-sugar pyrophosphorylase involved in lipopolysaccharide biosynthesis/translation initiation factor 2B, gamma/epsilon subunits (eIF-2Bgamma/eIF-2Bepsilon)